jgi:hypothetical protein
LIEEGYVSVYHAEDEATANIVKAALEDAGIPTIVERLESSMFDGAFVNAEGYWGDLVVAQADEVRALELLKEYEESETEE